LREMKIDLSEWIVVEQRGSWVDPGRVSLSLSLSPAALSHTV